MYPKYFGLKETSFSITPDPHYLFLSQQHREALAHLLFGISGGGGFVLLTGEVGTGKTTVCRAFLEQAPEQVDIALILNPALTVNELLQVICREFGIELVQGELSNKVLMDQLNDYLLQAHAAGRKPVLMIDEAQNLKPEVLEQIRLLTNLETTKHKLLQIFLVGQPELRDLLQKNELRQLAQRITARYHLSPLDEKETRAYIQHRLAVAGVERPLFDKRAVNRIYRLSEGIPRLINILCDRALLGAYATNRQQVNSHIVSRAARELAGEDKLASQRSGSKVTLVTLFLLLAAVIGLWLVVDSNQPDKLPTLAQSEPAQPPMDKTEPPAPAVKPAVAAPIVEPVTSPLVVNEQPAVDIWNLVTAWDTGIASLLKLWDIQQETGTPGHCAAFPVHGLYCREIKGTWNNLRHYDRPALLKLRAPSGASGYLLLSKLNDTTAQVLHHQQRTEISTTDLDAYWYGEFTLLWRPSEHSGTLITSRSPASAIAWLNQQLSRAAGEDALVTGNSHYDTASVKGFQATAGLQSDGIAGPDTLIHLNNIADLPGRPRLRN